jgi:hypothetical protein
VLLGEIPPLLRDVVRGAVALQSDMILVELPARPGSPTPADLVIVALPAKEEADECARLLYADPLIKVLAIEITGGQGSLYELQPKRASLGELSPEGLVQAIRRSCARETAP